MYSYSIIPLDTSHVSEICDDIVYQYENGIADCALFLMASVPEGNPPIDKARIFGEKYVLFRDELRRRGHDCGILVQCSIGHGYPLNAMFPFQRYTNLTDGAQANIVCPYDEDFAEHFEGVMAYYASLEPKVIMVDDDFRLISRPGRGCACPLHMAEFNKRAGTSFNREELLAAMKSDSPESREYCRIFADIQHESLVFSARAMRRGIDRVNPKLQGIFCLCGSDPAGEIARILAGEGNPTILRVNNGCYTAHGPRQLTSSFIRAARQIGDVANKVDVYLAETDTCPQNRYSTSAALLHSHFTGTILEGASGAKHWITRTRCFEPSSGKAYRRQLAKYSGFYNSLAELVQKVRWEGCRIPLATKSVYHPSGDDSGLGTSFATCVLDRFGLPLYFGDVRKGARSAVFMSGSARSFSDDEVRAFLSGTLFIASDMAKELCERGFSEYLGVEVREWDGPRTSAELFRASERIPAERNGNAQMRPKELIPSEKAEIYSTTCHLKDGKEYIPLFPAVTYFENSLGGRVVVFCGTPAANFSFTEAFSFLTETRKAQLVELLTRCGKLPVWYPEDAEVYLRSGVTEDGTRLVSFFNIGLDKIDNVTLCSERTIKSARYLDSNGELREVGFDFDGERYVFELAAETLIPVILLLEEA